jgi:hypothetical protein
MALVQKSTDSSNFPEVADRILDKGIVIDGWANVSPVGIELPSRVTEDGGTSNNGRTIQDPIPNQGLQRLPDD